MMLARVGEQTGQAAYACVNRIPVAANRSTLGVSVKRAAKTAEVSPTQIIDEKKDDVRAIRRHGKKRCANRNQQQTETDEAGHFDHAQGAILSTLRTGRQKAEITANCEVFWLAL